MHHSRRQSVERNEVGDFSCNEQNAQCTDICGNLYNTTLKWNQTTTIQPRLNFATTHHTSVSHFDSTMLNYRVSHAMTLVIT